MVGFERTRSPQLLQTFPLPDRNDWPDCKDSVIYSHQPWHTDLRWKSREDTAVRQFANQVSEFCLQQTGQYL